MSYLEEAALRRFSGARIIIWSLGFAAAGVAPLLLYIAVGPADANPIGLGLLAVFAVPVGVVGAGIGSIKMLVERFARRGR